MLREVYPKPPSDVGGAPRSEFEILMIASGDHTTIHRWLRRMAKTEGEKMLDFPFC